MAIIKRSQRLNLKSGFFFRRLQSVGLRSQQYFISILIFIFLPQNLGAVGYFSVWSRMWVLSLIIFSFVFRPFTCRYWRHLSTISYLTLKNTIISLKKRCGDLSFCRWCRVCSVNCWKNLLKTCFLDRDGGPRLTQGLHRDLREIVFEDGRELRKSWIRRMERVQGREEL